MAAFAGWAGGTLGTTMLAATLSGGCVNPKSDYDDWLARTGDARSATPPTVDSGPIESAPPDGGFDQTYFMACESQLSPGNPGTATVFSATLKFTPQASGGGGSLDYSNTPLVVGAQSLTDVAGPPGTASCTVGADGQCDLDFGANTIPAAANAVIPGQEVDFAYSSLHMVLGQDNSACANLSGHITLPTDVVLDPAQNICIYIPSTGAAVPLTQQMFDSSPCHH